MRSHDLEWGEAGLLSPFQTLNLFPWQSKDSRAEIQMRYSSYCTLLRVKLCKELIYLFIYWVKIKGIPACSGSAGAHASSVARQIHLCERGILGRGRQNKKRTWFIHSLLIRNTLLLLLGTVIICYSGSGYRLFIFSCATNFFPTRLGAISQVIPK